MAVDPKSLQIQIQAPLPLVLREVLLTLLSRLLGLPYLLEMQFAPDVKTSAGFFASARDGGLDHSRPSSQWALRRQLLGARAGQLKARVLAQGSSLVGF